jgi:hypothetical protein
VIVDDLPIRGIEGVPQLVVHRPAERAEQPELRDLRGRRDGHLAQEVGDLAMDLGERCRDFGSALKTSEIRRLIQRQQRSVQAGQGIVVQDAPRAPVEDLTLGQALTLEGHQTPRHLGAGLRVNQSFAARSRDFDFFLRVQPTVCFFAQ